ncbi:MAG: enoyl-CoA hydratase/isomerase family protein [Candidatus Dormibacteraeota bacterium]|nr:enoyl-CoA hydratase/isomerase family protein [Candidatus Dormibacteraeota bacterium]
MEGIELVRRGRLAHLTIDRPQSRNALNLQAMADLDAALAQVAGWDVHGVFIRGAGEKAFISGGDLKELETIREESVALEMARQMRATLDRIPGLPMPVIAVINGQAIGGGAEVAIACDYRLAAAHATIGFVQARLGMMPGWGGVERLVQTVGRGRALQLLTTGRTLSAGEAAEIGLIEEVVPSADLDAAVARLAGELEMVPAHALAGIKRAVEAVQPFARPDLADRATEDFAHAWAHDDHWAAMERALEGRRR